MTPEEQAIQSLTAKVQELSAKLQERDAIIVFQAAQARLEAGRLANLAQGFNQRGLRVLELEEQVAALTPKTAPPPHTEAAGKPLKPLNGAKANA
jgi:hypothetical protein